MRWGDSASLAIAPSLTAAAEVSPNMGILKECCSALGQRARSISFGWWKTARQRAAEATHVSHSDFQQALG